MPAWASRVRRQGLEPRTRGLRGQSSPIRSTTTCDFTGPRGQRTGSLGSARLHLLDTRMDSKSTVDGQRVATAVLHSVSLLAHCRHGFQTAFNVRLGSGYAPGQRGQRLVVTRRRRHPRWLRARSTAPVRRVGAESWSVTRRVLATAGAIVLAFVTGFAAKVAEVGWPTWSGKPDEAGPVYVSASPQWTEIDPLVRTLPTGVGDRDRETMSRTVAPPVDNLGIPVGLEKLRVVIQAKDTSVLLTGLRLVVDERRQPLTSTLLVIGTEGGGAPIQVQFDADSPGAESKRGIAARNLKGQDYFDGSNYELNAHQSVEFRANVTTHSCYCRWHLEVDTISRGVAAAVPIRRGDGSLFELSAATRSFREVYTIPHPAGPPRARLGAIGRWIKVPPRQFCSSSSVCDPSLWPDFP